MGQPAISARWYPIKLIIFEAAHTYRAFAYSAELQMMHSKVAMGQRSAQAGHSGCFGKRMQRGQFDFTVTVKLSSYKGWQARLALLAC